MKTTTFKQKKKSIVRYAFLLGLFVLAVPATQAQVQTNGILFIGDGGTFFVESSNYAFGTGGTSATTRTPSTYGKLILAAGATTSGATSAHFLNGYVSRMSATPFIVPIGQSGVYAPIGITPSSTTAVDAAYFRESAVGVSSTLDGTVGAISTVEYWSIIGTNSTALTLTWRASSNLASIGVGTSTANLTIVGYDGVEWVKIPSTVDATSILGGASSITTGSITSSAAVNLNMYQYFSLGRELTDCPLIVASSGTTKTWTGSWAPSAPTIADPVVISTAYSAGSFACNSLVLNADITLANGQNIEIVNAVTGSGKIVMASQASVVQRATSASAPNIVLTKRSRTTMRLRDYIYWGTPIAGDFLSQLSNAQASTATQADAFGTKIKYVSGGSANGGWQNLDAVTTGQGFATRIKNQAPFTNIIATDFINLTFTGVANNGDIVVPVTNDPTAPNGARSHVLLANPYPSAIDAEKFITENTNIDGVVYIWTAATGHAGGVADNYSQADYISYTLAGSVVPNAIISSFNGKIASGQGFKVKSLTNNGNVTFTNCMRLTSENTSFFKTKQTVSTPRDSYKLNMTGDNGVFSQILITYLPEATLGYDRLYDAGRNSVSTAKLFSMLEEDGRSLAINARPPFNDNDVVSIGITKNGTALEKFAITLTEKTGIFATNEQSVYIYDTENNTYHDLNNGDFIFNTDKNAVDRYKIVYTARTLSNPKFENNGVYASLRNNVISLEASQPLTGIEVFDITGRKILESQINNKLTSTTSFVYPASVYIVKAKLGNGTVASFKLVNQN